MSFFNVSVTLKHWAVIVKKIAEIEKLAKLVSFCRKKGVLELKLDGIEIKLSPSPIQFPRNKKALENQNDNANEPEQKPLTEEDMLLWSAQPAMLDEEPESGGKA